MPIATQYLPCSTLFSLGLKQNGLCLDDMELYNRPSLRNSCFLPHGNKFQRLTVPTRKSKDKTITSIEISYDENWMQKHLRTIQTLYGKAPFTQYVIADLNDIYNQQWTLLWDLNQAIMTYIMQLCQLEFPIYTLSDTKSEQLRTFKDMFTETISEEQHGQEQSEGTPCASFLFWICRYGPAAGLRLKDKQ